MDVVEELVLPEDVVPGTIALLESFDLSVWLYQGADWFVRDLDGPHVAHESNTVQFAPTVVDGFDGLTARVAKIVGVSDDFTAVAAAEKSAQEELGDHVAASRSQNYYLDVTHPRANKGGVVTYLSAATGSRRTRSPRSATCRTTCSCSRAPGCRSRWASRAARCTAPRGA